MATQRDLQPLEGDDRMGRLNVRDGYVLGANQRVEDILAADAELLRSEGIDPTWQGFSEPKTS